MIQVTDEQIAERDQWESKLKLGVVNLMDGLFLMLHTGAPATPYLLERLIEAHTAYNEGRHDDLAAAFGCELTRSEKHKDNHESWRTAVKCYVEGFHDLKFPLLNPNQHPDKDSAFKKTAESFGKSPSTVFSVYYNQDAAGKTAKKPQKKKLKKRS